MKEEIIKLTEMIEIVEKDLKLEFFHNSFNQPFASVWVDELFITFEIGSSQFEFAVRGYLYKEHKILPTANQSREIKGPSERMVFLFLETDGNRGGNRKERATFVECEAFDKGQRATMA